MDLGRSHKRRTHCVQWRSANTIHTRGVRCNLSSSRDPCMSPLLGLVRLRVVVVKTKRVRREQTHAKGSKTQHRYARFPQLIFRGYDIYGDVEEENDLSRGK